PGFPRRQLVITDDPAPGIRQTEPGPGPAPVDHARVVSYGPQRVVATADSRGTGMLVLTDVYYPGWKVTVDGKPEAIRQVDYLLKGVLLSPGHHRVTFSYQPSSFKASWIISAIGVIALVALVVTGRRWRSSRHSLSRRREVGGSH